MLNWYRICCKFIRNYETNYSKMQKILTTVFFSWMLFSTAPIFSQVSGNTNDSLLNDVQSLKDSLSAIMERNTNELFKNHCNSFIEVIDSNPYASLHELELLSNTYDTFCSPSNFGNPRYLSSYTNRERSFVFSWKSPTDGQTSFSLLTLPKNWNPDTAYPLYVQLHGFWSVANSPIEFMTYYFTNPANTSFAYDDGYSITPWGRGNLWYEGISETDIWECIAELKNLVQINPKKQFITGHSMGGYGAWSIASKSIDIWAGMGIHAGALWYNYDLLNDYIINKFKYLPTYFVTGLNDQLYSINNYAYNLLREVGNINTKFVSFEGGHEYVQTNVENMYLWLKNPIIVIPKNKPAPEYYCFTNYSNNTATIKFVLAEFNYVKLVIYNSQGIIVSYQTSNMLLPGSNEFVFSINNLPTGLYFCKLLVKDSEIFKSKLLLVK
jgi:predicted esterase